MALAFKDWETVVVRAQPPCEQRIAIVEEVVGSDGCRYIWATGSNKRHRLPMDRAWRGGGD